MRIPKCFILKFEVQTTHKLIHTYLTSQLTSCCRSSCSKRAFVCENRARASSDSSSEAVVISTDSIELGSCKMRKITIISLEEMIPGGTKREKGCQYPRGYYCITTTIKDSFPRVRRLLSPAFNGVTWNDILLSDSPSYTLFSWCYQRCAPRKHRPLVVVVLATSSFLGERIQDWLELSTTEKRRRRERIEEGTKVKIFLVLIIITGRFLPGDNCDKMNRKYRFLHGIKEKKERRKG